MPPFPNIEHQDLQFELAVVLREVVKKGGLGTVYTNVNVSDREADWEHNFRVPDLAVFLNGNVAKDCRTHWVGGPDLAVEIVSPGDRTREKPEFYAALGVRELLLIDRNPWSLELYRLAAGKLTPIAQSNLPSSQLIQSQVLPLSFRLVAGGARPNIELVHLGGSQKWLV